MLRALVLREATGFKPKFLVGLGQDGLVAAVLRWPLVVELTLQARNLQRKEARAAGSTSSQVTVLSGTLRRPAQRGRVGFRGSQV